ncbi:MAG TPA: response regulator [Hyphomonadaceae bacterium]|nr:response regulator [Hyphomonadaceae bacterium]HPI49501.1 response regulator [Hyphomonadaceae bacterium]
MVSGLLFVFIGATTGWTWLAVVLTIEAAAWYVRTRLVAGDLRFRIPHLVVIGAVSLAWVALSLMLWSSEHEVARLATIVALFSVSMYGVAGGYKSAPILLVLVWPPLLALFVILTNVAWTTQAWGAALFTTLATIGACATIVFTGVALHRSDHGLEKANAELRALTGRLTVLADREKAASRAKDVLIANVSHEVRTPLNGIVGLVSTLDRSRFTPADRETINAIQDSGDILERLIADLLDTSAIESGQLQLRPISFDPVTLARSTTLLMEGEARQKGLSLTLTISPDSVPGNVVGDDVRIRQIMFNLISNAIKYTASGIVTINVDVQPDGTETALLRLSVTDTGHGFDLASHDRLFDRFERGEQKDNSEIGGLGLGLSITRALVGCMGGKICVNSTAAVGSTFDVILPLPRAEAPLNDSPPEDSVPGAQPLLANRLSPLRVLLVEDHPINRRVVTAVLEPLHVQVDVCLNGLEAVEAAAATQFDVILMDLLMPVMDGLEATRAIRLQEIKHGLPRTAIIMLTASALPSQIDKAKEAGCDAHLAKPVTASRLFDALAQVMKESAHPEA